MMLSRLVRTLCIKRYMNNSWCYCNEDVKTMYKDYISEGRINGIKQQHNIMVIVGNGFDISVMKKYREDSLVPSYKNFYDFLQYRGINQDNLLFRRMTEDRAANKENWSDFENTIYELLSENYSAEVLESALKEIQSYFLLFLNDVVTTDIPIKLNNDTETNKLAQRSLKAFLGDLDKEDFMKMSFPRSVDHYHMLNYLFVNFNYTSLLDNYIFLDKNQFDPHPYKTVDTNFSFYPNPKGYSGIGYNEKTVWSSFLMSDIIHPHGYQNIPRSMLFGVESDRYRENYYTKRLVKSYWAQDNQKYQSYFDNTELFIIYGASLGITDSWWWNNIFESILNRNSELIIYSHSITDKDSIKCKFIDACQIECSNEDKCLVSDRISVASIKEGKTILFSLG